MKLEIRDALLDINNELNSIEDLVVAMEELSELQQAISKYLRGKKHNIPEELADVEIVLGNIRRICNIDEQEVEDWKTMKRNRLQGGYR